jgi:membrane protein DedA with SNARE-associated domain
MGGSRGMKDTRPSDTEHGWIMAKIRNADIFIITTTLGCIIMAAILYSNVYPEFNAGIKSISLTFVSFGEANGLWAAFLLSAFGNTSILIVIPYSYIVFQLAISASGVFPIWYPLVLGVISGLGAGIGEVTSYIVGRLFRKSEKLVNGDLGQKFERMRKTFEAHPKAIPFIVFLFAATPLPDDVILVPFGVMKYSYLKTIIPCMLGKMVLCILIAYLGFVLGNGIDSTFFRILKPSATSNPGDDMIGLIPLFLVVWLMIRIDFQQILESSQKRIAKLRTKLHAKPAHVGDKCPKCGAPMAETIVTEKDTGKRKKKVACGNCDALV